VSCFIYSTLLYADAGGHCSAKEQTACCDVDYVKILAGGSCIWYREFALTVTHCPMDITDTGDSVLPLVGQFQRARWTSRGFRSTNSDVRSSTSPSDTKAANLTLSSGRQTKYWTTTKEAGSGTSSVCYMYLIHDLLSLPISTIESGVS